MVLQYPNCESVLEGAAMHPGFAVLFNQSRHRAFATSDTMLFKMSMYNAKATIVYSTTGIRNLYVSELCPRGA